MIGLKLDHSGLKLDDIDIKIQNDRLEIYFGLETGNL